MSATDRHQARLDVERLRKAAERIQRLERALAEREMQIRIAADALRLIGKWATDDGATRIQTRATDTLRLINRIDQPTEDPANG